MAVGRQWIETFDPGEEVGQAFATVPSDEARVRPDGTSSVLVPTGDSDRFHVLDPIGGLLVEQGVDVDPAAVVGIGAGHAGVLGESGEAEIIELTTGERQDVDLTLPGGDPFAALGFVPEVDGHLAWDDGTNVVRWRDGRVVERLPLWPGPGTVSLTAEDGATRRLTGLHSIRVALLVVFQRDVPRGVYAFDTGAATSLTPSATIESPPTAAAGAAPARDGGIHVVLDDGRLRSYDATGHWTVEVPTGLRNASLVVTDPQTGSVAIGGENGAVLVDPATGSVQHVRNGGSAVALEFARDGALLVVVELDGSVGLWDTVRAESAGTLWQSSDGASRSATGGTTCYGLGLGGCVGLDHAVLARSSGLGRSRLRFRRA